LGPKAGAYQTSGLQDITGILGILGAAKEGSASSKLFDWLGGKLSGIDFSKLGDNGYTGIGSGTSYTNPNQPGYDEQAP